ncbi:efflux RND transporter periplasmic adaptor subunit [Lacipirellula sp.]|uniref:efflux RND transporter periplasmic adaptor subunit n=1 Tax=Lacipirellula sp. TaxID=2691419 RepID=UPI003D147443
MTARIFTFVLLTLALAGCREKLSAPAAAPPVVRTVQPISREVGDYVYFTGRLEAVQSVEIRSRVTGYLVNIDFQSGKPVKAGDRLFKIDPRPYQAQLDEANGQVDLAKARLQLAVADNARAKEVAKTPGAISQQDVDKYQASEEAAAAQVTAAEAASEVAALNLSFTNVVAPVDGIVSRNLLTIGNLVTQDQTLLTTVVSQDPIYAYFDVDELTLLRAERLIQQKKIQSTAQGAILPVQFGLANEGNEFPHAGTIDFINNQIDPSTGTLELRGVFSNPLLTPVGPRMFKPGEFVRIRLPLGPAYGALIIPQAAIGSDQGKKYLLTVNKENIVEYSPITLGPQQPGGLQAVQPVNIQRTPAGVRFALEGEPSEPSLTAESVIIAEGLQRVRPGAKVDPKPLQRDTLETLPADKPEATAPAAEPEAKAAAPQATTPAAK